MQLNSSFFALLCSTVTSGIAGTVVRVAVAWHLLSQTQSPLWLSGLAGMTLLLGVCSKPFLAAFIDAFGARRIYVVTMALGVPPIFLLALAPYSGSWMLAIASAALIPMTAFNALRDSAAPVLQVSLLSSSEVARGQRLRASSLAVVSMAGPLLAGFLVQGQSPYIAFAAAVVISALAFYLASRIQDPGPGDGTAVRPQALKPSRLIRTALESVRCVWGNSSERSVVLASALMNCAMSALMLILLPAVVNLKLRGAATDLAAAEMGLGVGMLLGSLVLTARLNKLLGSFTVTWLGALAVASSLIAATLVADVRLLVVAQACVGVGLSAFMVNTSTMRGLATPAAFRARTMNGAAFLNTAPGPLFALLVGATASSAGIEWALGIAAAACAAAAFLMVGNAVFRRLSALPPDELKGAYEPLYPKIYGGSTDATKSA